MFFKSMENGDIFYNFSKLLLFHNNNFKVLVYTHEIIMITNDETSKPVFSSLDINKDKRLIVLNILYNSSVVDTHILNNGMNDRHHENANDNVFFVVFMLYPWA